VYSSPTNEGSAPTTRTHRSIHAVEIETKRWANNRLASFRAGGWMPQVYVTIRRLSENSTVLIADDF
jgi:hypothetical protein